MAVTLNLDVERLRSAIQLEYSEVATCPVKGFHFHVGRPLTQRLGYDRAAIDALPEPVVESFAGVGNPFVAGQLPEGAIVLEIGSGAGLDAILAARQVGPQGRVIGVDMTEAMLAKARANAELAGAENVEFRQGLAEELPVADESADIVISNGVINLCPDKEKIFQEIFRVLKPGGRLQIADIVVAKEVPLDAREDIDLWTG
ncbi:MAG TPA: methyltransferase domain-containing protein [Chloroflexota bacterium]|nr:methyltransferase domain-containing protein [Chloroflexota bacterium]